MKGKQPELHAIVSQINAMVVKHFPDAIIADYGLPESHPRKQTLFLITLKYVLQDENNSCTVQLSYYLYDTLRNAYLHLEDFIGEKPEVSMLTSFVSFDTKSVNITYRFANQDVDTVKKD
jgi:hypothetical protein